ncbi:MAG: PH domain-containing protein [Thermoanaerobaculia bacterium]|jgi:hypothetical protein
MIQQFSSKRDLWLTVVILLSAIAIGGAAISSALQARWLIAAVLSLSTAAILWVFFGTRYTVTDSELIIRSGPLRWTVARASITSVEPTTDPTASPASSLDRLEIRYGGGSRRVLVSPEDKQGFCAALKPAS